MKNERIEYLIKQYAGNNMTPVEEAELMQLLLHGKTDLNEIKGLMNETWEDDPALLELDNKAANRIFEQIVGVAPVKAPFLICRLL